MFDSKSMNNLKGGKKMNQTLTKTKKSFKVLLLVFFIVSSVLSITPATMEAEAASTTKVSIVSKNVTYLHGPDTGTPVRMIDRLRDSANKGVEYSTITSGYWKEHLYGFGRVLGG